MRIHNKLTVHLIFYLFMTYIWVGFAHAQVTPTNEWVNFYSTNTLLNGVAVPVGTIIDAYDPDGIHCGTFTVKTEGEYGFLVVYRDDILTSDVDEGASPGDTINFKINNIPTKVLGPDVNIWTSNGAVLEVDLANNLAPFVVNSIADIIMNEDAPDSVIADLDMVFLDPDNDSLRFSSFSSLASVVNTIDSGNQVTISLAANWFGDAELIFTANDGWDTVSDTVGVLVNPINDPPVITGIPDTSFVNNEELILNLNDYVEDIDNEKSSFNWVVEVAPAIGDSVEVFIFPIIQLATFSAKFNFAGKVPVVFTVTDDSLASDRDTMLVRVDFPTGVEEQKVAEIPQSYILNQNYPNPFNPETTISFGLPNDSEMELVIYNVIGRKVRTLLSGYIQAGWHNVTWDGSDEVGNMVTSGVYVLKMKTGTFSSTHKMTLLR